MLATVHEEYCEDDVDSEWEDFDRLMEEYRLRRRNIPASPLLSSVRHYDHRRAQEQAFYPCPPPQPSELIEDLDYVQTVVSLGTADDERCQGDKGATAVFRPVLLCCLFNDTGSS
jgi:hypothetical protein